ncbi:unnamed protein product [Protopolystoma xenopodis]|uniref:Uncharacterized protein n=1 Tax=Protopolystoma xenopodis TaxID=117903 RepID=A0A448X6U3_9PLAT|nr:unnamed protein product [Protopolystoma xenopodis]
MSIDGGGWSRLAGDAGAGRHDATGREGVASQTLAIATSAACAVPASAVRIRRLGDGGRQATRARVSLRSGGTAGRQSLPHSRSVLPTSASATSETDGLPLPMAASSPSAATEAAAASDGLWPHVASALAVEDPLHFHNCCHCRPHDPAQNAQCQTCLNKGQVYRIRL